jgi:glycosyltransferase involved in cell wall biosynthesis
VAVKKSVAIVGTRGYPSYYGGFETAVRRLAPYLAEHGWDVTVYGRPGATKLDDPNIDERVKRVTTFGIETKAVSTLSYGLTASLHALVHKPDVALVMNVANGYFLPILKLRGVPTLVNVDGIEWDRAQWGQVAKAIFRGGARFTATFATELVCDAKAISARWQSQFKREGVFIPYGGDASAELPIEPGLQHRGYALVVARFVPENTIPEFLEAARLLSRSHKVVIVGSSGYGGELDNAAEELASANENVLWLGHVNDDRRLHSLWQHCGAYFHGHSVGGTNPALVQAMALGAPTVARDTIYNREVLADSGIFVEPTPGAIADALGELLGQRELQDRLSAKVIARANDEYTWELVCRRYMEQLERLSS